MELWIIASVVFAVVAVVVVSLYVTLTDPSRGAVRIAALAGLLAAATPLITVLAPHLK